MAGKSPPGNDGIFLRCNASLQLACGGHNQTPGRRQCQALTNFIQSVTGDLGVSESAAKSGVGSILSAVKGKADSDDFKQLLSSLPGAEGLLGQASAAAAGTSESGGGLMGGLGGIASALGGGSGSAMGLLGALTSGGLSTDQLGPFVSKFVGFAKESAGQGLVSKILGNVPELAKLVG